MSKKLSSMSLNHVESTSVPLKYTVDTYTSMCRKILSTRPFFVFCNPLPHPTPPPLFKWGANILFFLGELLQMSLNFFQFCHFSWKKLFKKKIKNFHIHCVSLIPSKFFVSTKTAYTCITHFANAFKNDCYTYKSWFLT